MDAKKLISLVMFIGFACQAQCQENTGMTIPPSLRNCYGNPDLYSRDKRLPMTMKTLVELIRKVELYKGVYFDMRTLSIAMLHRFRMDGIESIPDVAPSPGVVPFRLTGVQYPKHKLLFRKLIPGNAYMFPNESLTAQELCTLHFMLSSSVEPWERGDEGEVCPFNLHGMLTGGSETHHHRRVLVRDPDHPQISVQGAELSRCPIEDGVVSSKWGTLSPGTVVAAIAAALEPQQVQIASLLMEPEGTNDTQRKEKFQRYVSLSTSAEINNTWAATLAGDIAEVAVFQGPRIENNMYIGPPGEWNDTTIPRIHYMDQKHDGFWQMTDAEGRGGIDGIVMAGAVQGWEDQMNRLRLSQVLEMYYSNRGINFNPKFRACERETRLKDAVKTSSFLETQATNFARVLSYASTDAVQISDEKLEALSLLAVDAYYDHLSNLLSGQHCDSPTPLPKVHLHVILDGTWTTDDAKRVLAHLAEEADVSHFGSSMTVINGKDASWILQETYSPYELYKLQNSTDNSTKVTWPTTLNLKLSLATYSSYLAEIIAEERGTNVIGDPSSHVVVVLGYSATVSDDEHATSLQIISQFKEKSPDVRFVYVTSDISSYRFKDLTTVNSYLPDTLIVVPDSNAETVVGEIVSSISTVPGRLMSAYCDNGNSETTTKEFEDYVIPDQPKKYRIHPVFLKKTGDVSFTIQGSGYGELKICASQDEKDEGTNCIEVKDLDESSLKIESPCAQYSNQCPPVFITVTVLQSYSRCAEDDCRYPDQVRFLMRHEGLQCVKNPDDSNSNTSHRSTSKVLLYIILSLLSIARFKLT